MSEHEHELRAIVLDLWRLLSRWARGTRHLAGPDEGYWHGWPTLLARRVVCPMRSHRWRQTVRGVSRRGGGPPLAFYGRQCLRCWLSEPCPCLGCVE